MPARHAEQAVRERQDWARTHLERSGALREALAGPAEALLPSVVELRAFGESWPVEYRPTEAARTLARTAGAALVVSGAIDDADACLRALRSWRDRVARERLPALLAEVSSAVGIEYAAVSIRGQRTRWGSCSGKGAISLNRNLIFLPEHLTRYVLAHELAHVRVRNHGPGFHAVLESIVTDSAHHRRAMRNAQGFVPWWAYE